MEHPCKFYILIIKGLHMDLPSKWRTWMSREHWSSQGILPWSCLHSSSGCYAFWISSPICLPPYVCIPGLFSPSPKCFWDSAIWIHVSVVHLFSLLDNIIFYEYTIIYSSPVDGYLGCLHFFWIIQMLYWTCWSIFLAAHGQGFL